MRKDLRPARNRLVSVLGPLAFLLFIATFLVAVARLDAPDPSPPVVQAYEAPRPVTAEPLVEKWSRELPALERRLLQQQEQIERARLMIPPVAPRQ